MLYGTGFLFYASHAPERCAPSRFDTCLGSHQIWHVFVAAAAGVWVDALLAYTRVRAGCASGDAL